MKQSNLILLAGMLFFAICSAPAYAQSKKGDKLKAQIQELNHKIAEAITANDYEFLSSVYVDDVYSMPSYAPMLKGKEAMFEYQKKSHEAGDKMISMQFEVVDVIPAGDYVIEIGKYNINMEIAMMDGPLNDLGKYVTIWKVHEDGSLKIKLETWNTDINPWMGMMEEAPDKEE